jgi:hypothetical protein
MCAYAVATPLFCIKCLFMYRIDLLGQRDVSIDHFLCILSPMFLCFYVSLISSIQKTFIQKLNHLFVGFYVSCGGTLEKGKTR